MKNRSPIGRMLLLGLSAASACSGHTGTMTGADGPPKGMADLSSGAPTYTIETVDATQAGVGTAIAIDPTGTPQLFYFGEGAQVTCNLGGMTSTYNPGQLYHAVKGGAGYTRLMVNTGGNTSLAQVNGVSAVIDPTSGKPVVAFQGGKPGVMYCGGANAMLGNFNGTAWTLTTVANTSTAQSGMVDRPGHTTGPVDKSGDVVGPWSALAIDPTGKTYLAFQDIHFGFAQDDFSQADLEFAYNTGGGFVLGDEVDNSGAGLYNSMALDNSGRPVVAYSSYGTNAGISVAVRTGVKKWTFAQVVQGPSVAPSVAVSKKSGKIGVGYYDASLMVLKLAESTDGGATFGTPEVADHDGNTGQYTSLRYDQDDHPVIGYYKCGALSGNPGCDPATDAVRVARRDDSGNWTVTDVDTGGAAACGAYVSLALDSAGKADIIYQCYVFDHATNAFVPTVKFASEN